MLEPDSSSSCVSSSTSSPHQPENRGQKARGVHIQESDSMIGSTSEKRNGEDSPEQSNKLSSTGGEIKKTAQRKKVCGVCGDIAKSFHFGGLSCDSCKAFFRRSVHNDSYTGFRCAYDTHCAVDKNSRKGCQFCRFKKCLSIGMEKKWVMGEDEKNQLKQKKEKKPEAEVPKDKEFEPDVSNMLQYMTAEEKDEIECIVNKYQHSYREIPFRVSHCQGSRNTIEIIQMFTTILRRFAYFTKLLPEFTQLSVPDQSALLRASVLEMCLLRGALSFDPKNNRWPATEKMSFLKDCPQLRVEDMEKLVSKDLYDMHMQFINGMQELGADEPTVTILLLVVLFYPERGTLENQQYIGQIQEKYLLLLRKYVQWRYGPKGAKTFPKLLTKLSDLRQLNDSHTEYNLKMTKTEVERIQDQLGNLNLNPYPQWVLVEDQLNGQIQQSNAEHQESQAAKSHPYHAEAHQHQHQYSFPQHQQQHVPSQAQGFFMQFVNRKIPALINNPFTQFPIENELAYARSFFTQQQQLLPQNPHPATATHNTQMDSSLGGPMGGGMSSFRNILESTDQDSLRQLKESLSPTVLAKLQSVFGMPEPGGIDMNAIPQELINNFMAAQQNQAIQQQQQQMHQATEGYVNAQGQNYFSVPAGSPFSEPQHPMSQFNQSQLMDHFSNLQQQFSSPNYYNAMDMSYFQPSNPNSTPNQHFHY